MEEMLAAHPKFSMCGMSGGFSHGRPGTGGIAEKFGFAGETRLILVG
jgi:hypothetical protein